MLPLGQYRGFSMELFSTASAGVPDHHDGSLKHTMSLGMDIFGNIQRMDNVLDSMGTVWKIKAEAGAYEEQLEIARKRYGLWNVTK